MNGSKLHKMDFIQQDNMKHIAYVSQLSTEQKLEIMAFLAGELYGAKIKREPLLPRIEDLKRRIKDHKCVPNIKLGLLKTVLDLEQLYRETQEFANATLEQSNREDNLIQVLQVRVDKLSSELALLKRSALASK